MRGKYTHPIKSLTRLYLLTLLMNFSKISILYNIARPNTVFSGTIACSNILKFARYRISFSITLHKTESLNECASSLSCVTSSGVNFLPLRYHPVFVVVSISSIVTPASRFFTRYCMSFFFQILILFDHFLLSLLSCFFCKNVCLLLLFRCPNKTSKEFIDCGNGIVFL